MKKVLFIVHSYTRLGGVENVTRILLKYLSTRYELGVVTSEREEQLPNVSLHYYWMPRADDFNHPENLDFLEKTIREGQYGVIIDQGCISLVYRRFMLDEPYRFAEVLHACPKWLYISRLHSPKPVKGSDWKCRLRYMAARYIPFYCRFWANNLRREQLKHSAAFVVLSEAFRKELGASFPSDVRDGVLHVIPNPLEYNPIRSRRNKIVLYSGRLSHLDKRLDRLLRIWKIVENSHPDWKLQFKGDGPEKKHLENLAFHLKLKNVAFLAPENNDSLYADASISCLTSSYEGLSMSIIEAQQAGVVPMAFNINGCMSSLIGDNEFGLLIKPFKEKAYAQALGRLMDDKIRRDRIADDAMRHARLYSIDRIGPMWVELIEKL